MCVTQVDPDLRDDPDMQSEPKLVIDLLKEISNSLLLNSKAKQILGYCLANVQIFYRPGRKEIGKTLCKEEGLDLYKKLTETIGWIDVEA